MIKQNIILPLLLLTILGFWVQTGCTRATLPATLEVSKTPDLPSQTASLPPSPTTVETATPTPTVTPSPTSAPTALPTKLYKPLPTVVQPLDDQQRAAYIKNLLTTNGGCTLPCLLGVIPGQSSWEDVQRFYTSLRESNPFKESYPKNELTFYNYSFRAANDKLEAMDWGVGFFVSGNEIDLIRFYVGSPARNPAYTTHYSVKAVTAALGEPVKIDVAINMHSFPGTATSYVLDIYYHVNDTWLIFEYPGFVTWLDGETLSFCPTHPYLDPPGSRGDDRMVVFIQPGENLYSDLELHNIGIDFNGGYTFEKATGEDVSFFYQKMMAAKPDEEVCFNSKVSIWPIFGGAK